MTVTKKETHYVQEMYTACRKVAKPRVNVHTMCKERAYHTVFKKCSHIVRRIYKVCEKDLHTLGEINTHRVHRKYKSCERNVHTKFKNAQIM